MRISDWSSDVCSSDLTFRWRHGLFSAFDLDQMKKLEPDTLICLVDNIEVVHHRLHKDHVSDATLKDLMVWRDRKSVVEGTSVSVRVDLGGRRIIKKKKRKHQTVHTPTKKKNT